MMPTMRDEAAAIAGALSKPLGLSMAISNLTLPLAKFVLRFSLVEDRVDLANFVDSVDFGADEPFEPGSHDRFQVGIHARMADGVDAHVARRRAGCFLAAQVNRRCSSRAASFSLGATPSSMSSMIASALRPSALSIIFCRCPGTNIHERISSIPKISFAVFIT